MGEVERDGYIGGIEAIAVAGSWDLVSRLLNSLNHIMYCSSSRTQTLFLIDSICISAFPTDRDRFLNGCNRLLWLWT